MIIQTNIDALARLIHVASTEDTRYYLNGVHVRSRARTSGVFLEATNGHIAAVEHDAEGECSGDRDGAIVSRDTIREIIRTAKVVSKTRRIEVTEMRVCVEDKAFTLLSAAGEEIHPAQQLGDSGSFVDGTFPDVERVVPKAKVADYPRAFAAFNARYVLTLAESAVTLKKGTAHAYAIYQTDASSPAMMRVAGAPNWFGVIMPTKANMGDAARPEWFYRRTPKAERVAEPAAEGTEQLQAMTPEERATVAAFTAPLEDDAPAPADREPSAAEIAAYRELEATGAVAS